MNSKVVLLVGGLILLLAGAAAGYLYGVASTPIKTATVVDTTTLSTTVTTVSTSLDAYGQVANSFADHLVVLSSRNASAIVGQYEENASVTWTGNVGGLQGIYNGTKVIFLLMNASFIGGAESFSIGNATHTIVDISNDSALINSSFDISGTNYTFWLGGPVARFNGTVSAQDFYVYSPSRDVWLISTETWNFVSTDLEYPPPATG